MYIAPPQSKIADKNFTLANNYFAKNNPNELFFSANVRVQTYIALGNYVLDCSILTQNYA